MVEKAGKKRPKCFAGSGGNARTVPNFGVDLVFFSDSGSSSNMLTSTVVSNAARFYEVGSSTAVLEVCESDGG